MNQPRGGREHRTGSTADPARRDRRRSRTPDSATRWPASAPAATRTRPGSGSNAKVWSTENADSSRTLNASAKISNSPRPKSNAPSRADVDLLDRLVALGVALDQAAADHRARGGADRAVGRAVVDGARRGGAGGRVRGPRPARLVARRARHLEAEAAGRWCRSARSGSRRRGRRDPSRTRGRSGSTPSPWWPTARWSRRPCPRTRCSAPGASSGRRTGA